MSSTPLGIGLVGCGAMGAAHAQAIAELPTTRLMAVFDPHLGQACSVARQHGAEVAPSVDELVNRSDIVAVLVASPTPDHHDTSLLAARHGKHVLLEKPAALSLEELQEMQSSCDAAGVTLMVGQTMRFDGVVNAAREACHDGQIGKPIYVNWVSNTVRRWPAGWRAWQTVHSQSGGMALHLGIHFIDLALWLLDDIPVRVYAQGSNVASPALDVYDYLQISIRCKGGANALLESHSSLPVSGQAYAGLRLVGTDGQVQWDTHENGAYVGVSGSASLTYAQRDRLPKEIAHFIDCCRGEAQQTVTADQTWYALAAAIAASESLDHGRAVEVSPMPRGGCR